MKMLGTLAAVLLVLLPVSVGAQPPYVGPGGPMGWGPPALPQAPMQPLRVQRWTEADAYVVQVTPGGGGTEGVAVRVEGRYLMISENLEQQRSDPNRRMSWSSRYNRRVSLPRDADLSALQTEAKDGVLTVRVPRRGGWAPWQ